MQFPGRVLYTSDLLCAANAGISDVPLHYCLSSCSQGHDAANRLLLGIETAARDAERTVVPALERELRRGHHELQRALAQYKQSAGSTTTTGHPGASSSHLVHQPAGSQQRATSGLLDSSE